MRRWLSFIFIGFLTAALTAPAWACGGCGGRFPPGVNLRLLKLRLQNDSSSHPRFPGPPPPRSGEPLPLKPPSKAGSKKKSQKAKPAGSSVKSAKKKS